MIIVAHSLLGFAFGVRFPMVAAAPGVLVALWCWMTLPRAIEPLWLRHLNGSFSSCCGVGTVPAPQALSGSLAVTIGFVAAGAFLMRQHSGTRGLALPVFSVAGSIGVGILLVRGMSWSPVVPRDASELICSSSAPRVCVWPEHRERIGEVSRIALRASAAWRSVGISVPSQFSEYSNLSTSERSFGFSRDADGFVILNSLAYSMLGSYPSCAVEGTAPWAGGVAEEYVLAWLDATAGMSPLQLVARFGSEPPPGQPSVLDTVEQVRSLPVARQRAWFDQNLAALGTCDVQPQLEPTP